MMIQLTGLSGAGKTTLALAAQAALKKKALPLKLLMVMCTGKRFVPDLDFQKPTARKISGGWVPWPMHLFSKAKSP